MQETFGFIKNLYKRLERLESLLKNLLREEELLEENVLTKKGFLIKSYIIKPDAINFEFLQKLKDELDAVKAIENDINYELKENLKRIKEIERAYDVYYEDKLTLKNILVQSMNNAFYLSELAKVKADELSTLLLSLKGGDKKSQLSDSGSYLNKVIGNLERMTSEIFRFISLMSQLVKKFEKFTKESYYPTPKMYGRAMSSREFKKMESSGTLSASKDPTPVFDCPPSVKERLSSMSNDERKIFFKTIGVESIDRVVFFQTNLKPTVGPIPQKNGLTEYKFPKGIPVEVLEAA